MVAFLFLNVLNYALYLTFTVRKCAIAFLPLKMMAHQTFVIDPARTVLFDLLDQVCNGLEPLFSLVL